MLTIENLKKYGADTDSGVKRCANNDKILYEFMTIRSKFNSSKSFSFIAFFITKIRIKITFAFNISESNGNI